MENDNEYNLKYKPGDRIIHIINNKIGTINKFRKNEYNNNIYYINYDDGTFDSYGIETSLLYISL